jgi:hypothetical protein
VASAAHRKSLMTLESLFLRSSPTLSAINL